jgi:hypothetical protein
MTLAFRMQKPTAKESGDCVFREIPGTKDGRSRETEKPKRAGLCASQVHTVRKLKLRLLSYTIKVEV